MVTQTFSGVDVATQANVYFDGKCVSHGFVTADGKRKSLGVILAPATLTFATDAPETMEGVAGSCRVKFLGHEDWQRFGPGESFSVAGKSSFEIAVDGEPYHYICHYG